MRMLTYHGKLIAKGIGGGKIGLELNKLLLSNKKGAEISVYEEMRTIKKRAHTCVQSCTDKCTHGQPVEFKLHSGK